MNCNDLTSKLSKMLSYVAKHSKQRKTTKVIKLQRIASIWCQKHQTNAKLQKWSYYDEIASIWRQNDQNNAKLQTRSNYDPFASIWRQNIKTIKNVVFRRKTFKKTQNYESDQITMNCIDLTFKRWKLLSDVAKLQKSLNYNELHRFDVRTIKILSYVAKHSKHRKTTKWSNYNELHRFDFKTIQYAELRLKTFTTTLNYESDQIIMHCNDLTSKRSKKLSYVLKLQKWSNYNELHRFDVETIKTTQNYKRDQIMINLHRFDFKTIQYVELRLKTFKTTLNYESDQIIMHCNDLTSKRSKKLSYVPKLQNWSNYNELHWFDVKMNKKR